MMKLSIVPPMLSLLLTPMRPILRPFQALVTIAVATCVLYGNLAHSAPKTSDPSDELLQRIKVLEDSQKDFSMKQISDAVTLQNQLRALELRAIEDKLDVRKDLIANSQKSIDWWVATLAIIIGLLAVAIGAIPYLLARRQQDELKAEILKVQSIVKEIELLKTTASTGVSKIDEIVRKVENASPQSTQNDSKKSSELLKAVAIVVNSAATTASEKSYARGRALIEKGDIPEAKHFFRTNIDLNPTDAFGYAGLGVVATMESEKMEGSDKLSRLAEASSYFSRASQFDPSIGWVFSNWGVVLERVAMAEKGDTRADLLRDSLVKHERAVHLSSEDPLAHFNLASTLSLVANETNGPAKHEYRMRAVKSYRDAIALQPHFGPALNYLGSALGRLADETTGKEQKIQYLVEAVTAYRQSIALTPNDQHSYDGLSTALLNLLHEKPQEKEKILSDAEKVIERSTELRGRPNYNDACLAALKGESKQFVAIAERISQDDFPSKDHIDEDMDLDGIRDSVEFTDWYKKKFPAN
jgi:tetratricopeptide (TPR) repeat protein